MTWRSLLIQNSGKLSLHRKQMLIRQNGESYTVPLEDIAVIVVEHRETLITAPLLSALAEYGTTLLTCDEQFLLTRTKSISSFNFNMFSITSF